MYFLKLKISIQQKIIRSILHDFSPPRSSIIDVIITYVIVKCRAVCITPQIKTTRLSRRVMIRNGSKLVSFIETLSQRILYYDIWP